MGVGGEKHDEEGGRNSLSPLFPFPLLPMFPTFHVCYVGLKIAFLSRASDSKMALFGVTFSAVAREGDDLYRMLKIKYYLSRGLKQ